MDRHPELDRKLKELFPEQIKAREEGFCPFCGKVPGPLRNAVSQWEYEMSGICQACQDEFFGGREDEEVFK